MKKFLKSKAKGKIGVAFVQTIVSEAGSIFREVNEDTDIGIDGYIEFIENQMPIGLLIGVQIKSGYFHQTTNSSFFKVVFSQNDLDYFNIQPIPVALIAYDPESKVSSWLDITGYIRENPEILNTTSTSISLPAENPGFTTEDFYGKFRKTFQKYRFESDLFGYADHVASENVEEKFSGFVGLIEHQTSRLSRITCFLLFYHLFHKNETIRKFSNDQFSRYFSHPEVSYAPTEIIKIYVKSLLVTFGKEQIRQLLETAWLEGEENLMSRGTVSQSVGVIICNIPKYHVYLYELIQDRSESIKMRRGAMTLAAAFGDLNVINLTAANFYRIDWKEIVDLGYWLLQAYETDPLIDLTEFVDVYGYNAIEIADLLSDSDVRFAVGNEEVIENIWRNTSNPHVRIRASRMLNRIYKFRDLVKGQFFER